MTFNGEYYNIKYITTFIAHFTNKLVMSICKKLQRLLRVGVFDTGAKHNTLIL